MNYFVAVNGETVKDNISRDSAIKAANDVLTKRPELGTLNIGIGRYKRVKGVLMYCMHPCHFYF
jgi:hypothetical protein